MDTEPGRREILQAYTACRWFSKRSATSERHIRCNLT